MILQQCGFDVAAVHIPRILLTGEGERVSNFSKPTERFHAGNCREVIPKSALTFVICWSAEDFNEAKEFYLERGIGLWKRAGGGRE